MTWRRRLGSDWVIACSIGDLLNAAAQRAGAPELALEVLDVLGLLQTHPTAHARQAFQLALHELMVEMADQGQVILIGRAGCVLLRERPDVFHVRLVAPMDQRVERIAQQRSTFPSRGASPSRSQRPDPPCLFAPPSSCQLG